MENPLLLSTDVLAISFFDHAARVGSNIPGPRWPIALHSTEETGNGAPRPNPIGAPASLTAYAGWTHTSRGSGEEVPNTTRSVTEAPPCEGHTPRPALPPDESRPMAALRGRMVPRWPVPPHRSLSRALARSLVTVIIARVARPTPRLRGEAARSLPLTTDWMVFLSFLRSRARPGTPRASVRIALRFFTSCEVETRGVRGQVRREVSRGMGLSGSPSLACVPTDSTMKGHMRACVEVRDSES